MIKYSEEEIDRRVSDWHDGAGEGLSLAQYLGMTEFEYKRWAEDPSNFFAEQKMSVRPSEKKRSKIAFASPNTVPDLTAASTLKTQEFLAACEAQDVKPTKRQAARYNARNGRWAGR